eukprot:GHVP01056341.1.p1 GENE.GHVP01056341.1~~GHVP01056341.1.p1  ORF type:complete len:109 (+),score=0.43 GHVP01056341.1:916-1242(+)
MQRRTHILWFKESVYIGSLRNRYLYGRLNRAILVLGFLLEHRGFILSTDVFIIIIRRCWHSFLFSFPGAFTVLPTLLSPHWNDTQFSVHKTLNSSKLPLPHLLSESTP